MAAYKRAGRKGNKEHPFAPGSVRRCFKASGVRVRGRFICMLGEAEIGDRIFEKEPLKNKNEDIGPSRCFRGRKGRWSVKTEQ